MKDIDTKYFLVIKPESTFNQIYDVFYQFIETFSFLIQKYSEFLPLNTPFSADW